MPVSFIGGVSAQKRHTSSVWALHALPNIETSNLPAAHLLHASIVFSCLSTLCFHGTYFSHFSLWSSDSFGTLLRANGATIGSMEMHVSALFYVWHSIGILNQLGLKTIALICLALSASCSFSILHKGSTLSSQSALVNIFAGFGAFGWAGHLVHVVLPQQALLASGVAVAHLPNSIQLPRDEGCVVLPVDEIFGGYDGALTPTLLIFHHMSIDSTALLTPIGGSWIGFIKSVDQVMLSALAVSLGCVGSLSIAVSFIIPFLPSYGGIASSYSTLWALNCHHYWLGILFLVGAASHLALYALRSSDISSIDRVFGYSPSQRDILVGHLTWVLTFLGAHSVGILIHNDSMEALGRDYDTFGDTAIQVRPILLNAPLPISRCGSNDFLVFHVETFCIHTAVLILVKGFLVSRSSRLIADKNTLGFLYPCDGPGRGGTCQISPWDHVFLGAFWAYNTGSVGTFHWFWYAQSTFWTVVSDWTVSAPSINGWLRSFLWAESAQVIQAYGTPCSSYSLAFLTGHFVWALSLMFLFSGRGYWQELLESLIWVHVKLQLVPSLQPRALSISVGRAVGVIHFLAGGISVTWAFTVCRLLSL